MKREIKPHAATVELPPNLPQSDIREWFEGQAPRTSSVYLLAHADDGVIWGRCDNGQLITANDVMPGSVSPELRADTLQQARLFWSGGEIFLWRDGDRGTFKARSVNEDRPNGAPTYLEAFDEAQILWGDHVEAVKSGFSRMSDGAEGLRHIVPIPVTAVRTDHRPLRLVVRHYVEEDDQGVVRVVLSRLVDIKEE